MSFSPWGRKESDRTEQLTLSLFKANRILKLGSWGWRFHTCL